MIWAKGAILQPGIFPGRRSVLNRFRQVLATGKLSQAYLFVGPEGAGKEVTALEIARLVNCPCQPVCTGDKYCESCQKAATFQHPDIRWIGPAPATVTVGVVRDLLDAKRDNPFYQPSFAATSDVTIGDPEDPGPLTVRSLLRFLRLHPFQGRYKIAVVADAHRMTPSAANAFLKSLEEPPPNSLIMLLTTSRTGMLSTIASRCQQLRFDHYEEMELAVLIGKLRGVDSEVARRVAHVADGNARRAIALLEPEVVALQQWASHLCDWIHAGKGGSAQVTADQVHAGLIPAAMAAEAGAEKLPEAKDNPAKRERAIQLCEMLNLYYSELLTCRTRGDDWRPRLLDDQKKVRQLALLRDPATLLRDIASVEAAKQDIDHNLNIGLTLAVLFEGLIDHAQRDQSSRAS
jgi:DNA polymerase-3 subunit delta'